MPYPTYDNADFHTPTDDPRVRAEVMALLTDELAIAVGRMWRYYEVNACLNDEQPPVSTEVFAASLDEWFHGLLELRGQWAGKAGLTEGDVHDVVLVSKRNAEGL